MKKKPLVAESAQINNYLNTRVCRYHNWMIVLVGVVVFTISAFFFYSQRHHCDLDYEFINPDFVCDKNHVISKKGYAATQDILEDFISSKKSVGEITEASIYFRDLRSGPVFGVNEFEDFAPASLLKLPFALVYLNEAEEFGDDVLNRELMFTGSAGAFKQNFVSVSPLKENTLYSIEELLHRMISYSDNDAYQLLFEHLYSTGRKDIIRNTYLEFGILAPKDSYDQVVSVRRYASLFRGLFNVSLVNHEMSEKVLSWLAMSEFKLALAAGIPQNVQIAHKFGERTLTQGLRQLHDCGIVYYPDNPYLLCVMTEGKSFEDLVQFISRVSQIVYEEVDSRRL